MSNSSREYSPDWLREFKATSTNVNVILSSSSDESNLGGSSPVDDDKLAIRSVIKKPLKDDYQLGQKSVTKKTPEVKSPGKQPNRKTKDASERKGGGRGQVAKRKTPVKPLKHQEPKSSLWTLSSDSESCPDASTLREDDTRQHELSEQETSQHLKEEDKDDDILGTLRESSLMGATKIKSPKKRLKVEDMVPTKTKGKTATKQENDDEIKVSEVETTEKQTGPYVSSSRLPLLLAEKVQRSKALVECEGESIDLSGDVGSVGRVVVSDSLSGNQDMLLDLKGTIYKTTIIPSRTFCVVSFGQSEAKIEAIMNDFIQLKPQSNVYEAETMVEGTLEGFSFDSEEEGDNHAAEKEGDEQQTEEKGKGKAEKKTGAGRKKGKAAAKKPAKKAKKKAPAAKKSKTKK